MASLHELIAHGATAEARHLGILILDADEKRSSNLLLDALSDPEPAVAQLAQTVLRRGDIPDEVLLTLFDQHASLLRDEGITPPPLTGPAAAACRALAIIAERAAGSSAPWTAYRKSLNVPSVDERLASLGNVMVPLPGIPPRMRQAILREYLPGERTTDPRFYLEGLALASQTHNAPENWPARAHKALVGAGLTPGDPIPIGGFHDQGEGSYSMIKVDGIVLDICDFAPYWASELPSPRKVASTLRDAGFEELNSVVGRLTFSGLPVSEFGNRKLLSVGTLLFFWHD